jgi:4-hydroxy-tetrahydrodipicolinate reductase
MANIGLIGYGKMGKAIENQLIKEGHHLALVVDVENRSSTALDSLRTCDVLIEFTEPGSVLRNISWALEAGVPLVVGTTGWYQHLEQVQEATLRQQGTLLWASNFSIGVNLFFMLNEYLATLMSHQPAYTASIHEVHHVHKKDAPSGTAISLAEGLVQHHPRYPHWIYDQDQPGHLKITSERVGEVPGIHEVSYLSAVDTIQIRHEAFSRDGFALGAVKAATWLIGKKGFYSIRDMMQDAVSR